MAEFTPMMQQYLDVKKENQDAILFYRLGDFYEMFFDDAKTASKELELALTGRDCGMEERAPMCGVPYHSAEGYIARLIQKGYKVAICEQTEDPSQAKGLVRREVIRTVTPGTVTEASMLDENRNNFIAAAYMDVRGGAVCFCDLSTGELSATAIEGGDLHRLSDELCRYSPRELLLSDFLFSNGQFVSRIKDRFTCYVEPAGEWRFVPETAAGLLEKQMDGRMDVKGLDANIIRVGGGLLSYLHETQKNDLSHIGVLNVYSGEQFMQLDSTAARNLELTSVMRSGEKKGSLLWVLDSTKTAAGSRMLRRWIEKPLVNLREINARHEAVEALIDNFMAKDALRELLGNTYDMERIISRVVFGSAGGRDLRALASACALLPEIKSRLGQLKSRRLEALYNSLDLLEDIYGLIDASIDEKPPFSVREGGIIKKGFSPEVDELRSLLDGGAGRLAEIEARERERTGIKNLKVSYNKVYGYYIEVSRLNASMVPDDYIRK